jgi:hypothetical protein
MPTTPFRKNSFMKIAFTSTTNAQVVTAAMRASR